jgi:hypothetical protein
MTKTYDPESHRLATFFLECTRLQRGSEDFIRHADKLAIAIQECVEDYLKDAKL